MKHANHRQNYTPEPAPFEHDGPDLYDIFAFLCLCGCMLAAALAYFDVLVK